ncbi:MAG: hypothetical protein IKK83_05000 [Clostridia bacterium]|nr:hypothetical protein [Clostridia bacterium]
MKKITALALAIITLLFTVSCSGDPDGTIELSVGVVDNADEAVMSYDGKELSSGMYAFIFSYLKSWNLYYLQYYGSADYVDDTERFWNIDTGNGTYGENTVRDINDHCKMLLICEKLAADYGVTLDSEEKELVEGELNDFISAYGSEGKLSEFLVRYGITVDDLEAYLEKKHLVNAVQDELCAESGLCEVKKTEVYDAIAKEYRKVTHLYLLDSDYNGDATAKAKEIADAVNGGKALSEYKGLSKDNMYTAYPDGEIVELAGCVEEYAKLAEGLKAGECGYCKVGEGAYVMLGFDMTDSDKDSKYETVYAGIANERFLAAMADRYGLVELNSTELAKYDIITADTIDF